MASKLLTVGKYNVLTTGPYQWMLYTDCFAEEFSHHAGDDSAAWTDQVLDAVEHTIVFDLYGCIDSERL